MIAPYAPTKKKKRHDFMKKNRAYFIIVFHLEHSNGIPRQCFELSSKWDEIILISHLSKAAIVFLPCSHTHTHVHACPHTGALLLHNAFLSNLLQLTNDSTIESLHSSTVAAAEVTPTTLSAFISF